MPFELIKPDTHIDFVGQSKYAIALSLAILRSARSSRCSCARRRSGSASTSPAAWRCSCDFAEARGRERGRASARCCRASTSRAPSVIRLGEAERGRVPGPHAARRTCGEQNELVDQLHDALRRSELGERRGRARRASSARRSARSCAATGCSRSRVASVLLLVYIGFRFTPIFAPGAIVAQVHDVLVTAAVLVIFGPRVRPHRARRAARDPRLQHQRQDRRLRPHPREPGAAHRARLPARW